MRFSELVQTLDPAAPNSLLSQPDLNPEVSGVAAVDAAVAGQLSYIEGGRFVAFLETTQASALILPMDETLQSQATTRGIAWMSTPNPRLLFAKAIALFYQPFRPAPGIHPTAVIDPSVKLGDRVSIGAHVVIQPNVVLGDDVCIHPNVVIYPDVQVGDRTLLHANCVIHERTQIGADCVIHSGAVIGSEGFGFVPVAVGWVKIEQSGRTVLEDGVEIGCNSTVDRPAVGETRVGRNTKLDNLVHIGHGCQVGEGCAMAAQTGLAGAVEVGNRVIMGGQVGIANQAKIGDGVQIGAQSGIASDVAPGEAVIGTPAVPRRLFGKIAVITQHLPEMYQVMRRVQKYLDGKMVQ